MPLAALMVLQHEVQVLLSLGSAAITLNRTGSIDHAFVFAVLYQYCMFMYCGICTMFVAMYQRLFLLLLKGMASALCFL